MSFCGLTGVSSKIQDLKISCLRLNLPKFIHSYFWIGDFLWKTMMDLHFLAYWSELGLSLLALGPEGNPKINVMIDGAGTEITIIGRWLISGGIQWLTEWVNQWMNAWMYGWIK